MSGVEILGVAASVLQIAELGGKLSVKLFSFTRKIKNADKQIDSISQDIAATGAVLQQLGNELKKDEHLRLCSPEAITEARNLMQACRTVFDDLNDAIDSKGKTKGAGKWLCLKRGLNYAFVEDQILLLKAKLEHLKSSLLVMLNVLIFAGQLKDKEALPVLHDQRELLKQLVEEQSQNQRHFDLLLKRLDHLTVNTADDSSSSIHDKDASVTENNIISLVSTSTTIASMPSMSEKEVLTPHLPMHLHSRAEEIFDHFRLVQALIAEVDHAQYKLDLGIKYRAQQKILESHFHEWEKDWEHHKPDEPVDARYQYFEQLPVLKRYWIEQTSRNYCPVYPVGQPQGILPMDMNSFIQPVASKDPSAQSDYLGMLRQLDQRRKAQLKRASEELDNGARPSQEARAHVRQDHPMKTSMTEERIQRRDHANLQAQQQQARQTRPSQNTVSETDSNSEHSLMCSKAAPPQLQLFPAQNPDLHLTGVDKKSSRRSNASPPASPTLSSTVKLKRAASSHESSKEPSQRKRTRALDAAQPRFTPHIEPSGSQALSGELSSQPKPPTGDPLLSQVWESFSHETECFNLDSSTLENESLENFNRDRFLNDHKKMNAPTVSSDIEVARNDKASPPQSMSQHVGQQQAARQQQQQAARQQQQQQQQAARQQQQQQQQQQQAARQQQWVGPMGQRAASMQQRLAPEQQLAALQRYQLAVLQQQRWLLPPRLMPPRLNNGGFKIISRLIDIPTPSAREPKHIVDEIDILLVNNTTLSKEDIAAAW